MAARKTKATTPVEAAVMGTGRPSLGSLQQENNRQLAELQMKQKQMLRRYQEQPKVEVTVSPMYAPHFGNNQPVELNGCKIYVPCDGKTYKIPKSFAAEVKSRIRKVDDQTRKQKRLADIGNNVESYAGQMNLISRA